MTHRIPTDVQDRMLFAVDTFDEAHKVMFDGTSRDYIQATDEFWKAFAEWAPYALQGVIDIETASNGSVRVRFELPQ